MFKYHVLLIMRLKTELKGIPCDLIPFSINLTGAAEKRQPLFMNRRALSVCAIVSGFEPNDSEPRLILGSAWIHRVLVSILPGRGSSY